jgi:hypothetical protein
LEDVVRSTLVRIALTVALSLGATGALVAVEAPAFAGTANSNCSLILLPHDEVRAYCEKGPDEYRAGIKCKAYNGYYSYWRYGPWVAAGNESKVSCWSSAEFMVGYAFEYRSPGNSA